MSRKFPSRKRQFWTSAFAVLIAIVAIWIGLGMAAHVVAEQLIKLMYGIATALGSEQSS